MSPLPGGAKAPAVVGGDGGGEVVAGVPAGTRLVLQRLLVPVLELDPFPGGRRVEPDTAQLVRHGSIEVRDI